MAPHTPVPGTAPPCLGRPLRGPLPLILNVLNIHHLQLEKQWIYSGPWQQQQRWAPAGCLSPACERAARWDAGGAGRWRWRWGPRRPGAAPGRCRGALRPARQRWQRQPWRCRWRRCGPGTISSPVRTASPGPTSRTSRNGTTGWSATCFTTRPTTWWWPPPSSPLWGQCAGLVPAGWAAGPEGWPARGVAPFPGGVAGPGGGPVPRRGGAAPRPGAMGKGCRGGLSLPLPFVKPLISLLSVKKLRPGYSLPGGEEGAWQGLGCLYLLVGVWQIWRLPLFSCSTGCSSSPFAQGIGSRHPARRWAPCAHGKQWWVCVLDVAMLRRTELCPVHH